KTARLPLTDPFGKPLKTRPAPHGGLLASVSLSSDGKRLLTAQPDERVILWDADSGKEIHRYRTGIGENPKTDFNSLDLLPYAAISRDGKYVAAAGTKYSGLVFEISGKRVDGPRGSFGGHHTFRMTSMAWSDDGDHIVTGGQDKRAILT